MAVAAFRAHIFKGHVALLVHDLVLDVVVGDSLTWVAKSLFHLSELSIGSRCAPSIRG